MTGFGSGRGARVLIAALLLAFIAPLVPASYQSAFAQDATGGPELGTEFYDPPACSPAGTNGLVVYQTTGDDGVTPERSLVVAGLDGRTVRTIKLSGTPIRVLATPAPNMAVVITESSEHVATRVEVIDAGRGFRYRLAIPREDIGGVIFPHPPPSQNSAAPHIVLPHPLPNISHLGDLGDGVSPPPLAGARD